MAIYVPGLRDRHNRPGNKKVRSVVAMLSLTAMVDMFTVLAVFLLINFKVEEIKLSDQVQLPKAGFVKELKPAHVVVISKDSIFLDKDVVATFTTVKEQQEWVVQPLVDRLKQAFLTAAQKRAAAVDKIKSAVDAGRGVVDDGQEERNDRRVTVQADKAIDFLTVKKVMYTITEAGASEINFAVIKDESKPSVE